jgi:hypothetical protein
MPLENDGATPDVDQVIDTAATEVITPEASASIDDTIRNTLSEIRARGESGEIGKPEVPEDAEEKAQRIRDGQGKFAKGAPPVVGVDPNAQPAAAVAANPADVAPNTWKKEVAATWATLPPEVRAEVSRREADFHKGIEGYKQAAGFGQAMERVISPHAQTLQSLGISADKAIEQLMAGDHKLRYGSPQEKHEYFAQLARNYGIDMAAVQQVEHREIDPVVAQLQQQVQKLSGYIENQTQQGQQQEMASLNSEIANFQADPKHSHFESVKGHMAALLQAGQANSLADAYEQAIYANPTTRALVLAQQQADLRADAAKKAQTAKTAASVNTRPRSSMPVSEPIGTMDDTIRATLRRLQNA